MQIKLSVVIIAFNEEKNIARCLTSVQGIADEIVVVDSGSADNTAQIAQSMGARVIHQLFLGHIEQKNFAISQAQYKHCLSLDADEALDETLKKSIQEVKNNWQSDGYSMNRLTNFCGKWIKHTGWYPDKKLRLWNTEKGTWAGTNPHDKYEMQLGSTTMHLNGDILHYSFYSIDQHLKQIEYFTDISSKALFNKGKRSNMFLILFSPMVKFIRDFVIKLGFLDGYYGFIIAKNSAYAKYLKYSKLYKLQQTK